MVKPIKCLECQQPWDNALTSTLSVYQCTAFLDFVLTSSHFNAEPIALKLNILKHCSEKLRKSYEVQMLSENISLEKFTGCTINGVWS